MFVDCCLLCGVWSLSLIVYRLLKVVVKQIVCGVCHSLLVVWMFGVSPSLSVVFCLVFGVLLVLFVIWCLACYLFCLMFAV